jgi:ribonuclease HI
MAIIEALRSPEIMATPNKKVIFTDSIYSYHSILFYKFLTENAPERKAIENEDLIKLASHLVRKHKVSLVKIMSHTDEDKKKIKKLKDIEKLYGVNSEFYKVHLEGNKIADSLALGSTRDAIEYIKKALRA